MRLVRFAPLLMLLLATQAGAALDLRLPDMGDAAGGAMSVPEEAVLGRELMYELRQQVPLIDDLELLAYLNDLGLRLVSYSDRPQLEFSFFLVDAPGINAFAMPGGYIGINAGLLIESRSESELAAVLAHEIAHVTQRHLARRMAASRGLSVRTTALVLAAILIGSQNPQAGQAAAAAGMASSVQQQLNYSRAHEQEADRIGLQTLAAASFDPSGMPRFFQRMLDASRYGNRPPEYLSTHPITESRIADTAARAEGYGQRDALESVDFGLMRNRLIALKTPTEEALARFHAEQDSKDWRQSQASRYGLAIALSQSGRHNEARKVLAELDPKLAEHPAVLLAAAQIEQRAGNTSASLSLFRKLLELFPDHLAGTAHYAEALLVDEQNDDAYLLLSRRARDAHEPRIYWLLGRAAQASGRPVESKLALAEYYQLRGDLPSAILQIEQALAGGPDPHQAARATARKEQLQAELQRRQEQ